MVDVIYPTMHFSLCFSMLLCVREVRKKKHLFSSQVVLSSFIWFLMIILESIRVHTIYLEGRSFWTTWSTSFDVVCESLPRKINIGTEAPTPKIYAPTIVDYMQEHHQTSTTTELCFGLANNWEFLRLPCMQYQPALCEITIDPKEGRKERLCHFKWWSAITNVLD